MAAVADDVGRILAASAHSKGLELVVDIDPDADTELLGDAVRIQQVLLNLASNAVKFTVAGEVVIRVSVLPATSEAMALRFEVIDMGIGIAESDQQRLFHAFAQADSSTTRKFGGTGLGLAICRQLVELMGGTLGLSSAPGQGSTFWFELSLPRADRQQGPTDVTGSPTLEGQRVLIVDDNATNRKILRRQLLSWGVDAVEAVDAYQALGLAAQSQHSFDLAVIDLNMPGMDGIELAAILKANPETAAMTLFLLSSSGERLTAAESHIRGFAATMTKPVRSSELFDCLITHLHGQSTAPAQPDYTSTDASTHPEITAITEPIGTVLLVEDNAMNQLVGSKVLAKLGYRFDIANHGREAIEALHRARYDAILMDCQMPEMDGFEATAAIRRMEGTTAHTPIIAMTAAAMDGDRETCLAAGMDDYVTKPVRLDAIATVLKRWVARPNADAVSDRAALPAEITVPDPLDPSQIAVLLSLDDGAGALLREIVDQYLTQTVEARGQLDRVVDQGDTHALERAAHTLRGASANVGATRLAALCAEIETQGRRAHLDAGQLDGTAGLVERFDVEFLAVRDALTALTGLTALTARP